MPGSRGKTARVVCGTVGVGLLAVGVIGLAGTGLSTFAETPEGTVEPTDAGFGGSTLLGIIHVVFGALALLAAIRGGVRLAGLLGILAFAGLLAYDIIAVIADHPSDPLGSQWPTLIVHGVAFAASIVVAVLVWEDESVSPEYQQTPDDRTRSSTSRPDPP